MNENGSPLSEIKSASKRLAKTALDMGENRLQLLLLELEEERDKVLRAVMLGVGIFAFGLLAGIAFTIVIVLAFWEHPVCAASILTAVYAGLALFLSSRLTHLRRDWVSFSASTSQLQKDVSCLTEVLR
ncbi:MAG TPA: phage holin family protein [Verrucomicrobiae bacterium]|jgi:uncharacterized membrane protein YqjE